VPAAGDDAFVDLDYMTTMDSAAIAGRSILFRLESDDAVRRFGRAVGRRASRFPFPNDIFEWLRPLQDIARKAARPTTPEGRAFTEVEHLRIESLNGWSRPPFQLLLSVLLKPGTLPSFPADALPDKPDGFDAIVRPSGRPPLTSSQIADRLDRATEPAMKYFLWFALADAWADRCKPDVTHIPDVDVRNRVLTAVAEGAIAVEVLMTNEYPISRLDHSEQIDVAHLAPPVPT
jgi:hypothetical protein